jgi:phosphoesterase RecJ-like protein
MPVDFLQAEGLHVLNIDHHHDNTRFGDLNLIVPDASSTGEILADLLRELGVEITPQIAEPLYTAIVTDTGRFQYANAKPETLRLAAGLLALDVPATRIALEVFESAPFGYMKLLGRVLERAGLHARERFVYSWITQRDLAETGVGMDQTDSLIDVLRATRDADVAAMFKEQPDGRYRVSLRSRGPSVGAIARRHGGGGHELAAGMTVPDVETGVKLILEELRART